MANPANIDLNDLDFNLVYVPSPGSHFFELNPGTIVDPAKVLPQFAPWFRLFKGEDFSLMADMLNSLTVRAALAARQVAVDDDYAMALGDYNIMVNRAPAAPTDIQLPPIAEWVNGGYMGIWTLIKDRGRNASVANRIRLLPDGAETVEGFAFWDISQAGAYVRITPDLATMTRWLVA